MLELRGVTKRYGDRLAVDDLSLTVEPGQMFGFVGTNGAGKTTTMRIIMGVLAPDSGTVSWKGRAADADARRGFGYMPEERGLYPKMKVHEQLVYLAALRGTERTAAETRTSELLAEFGLTERANDRVEELSLGNQQRVQLMAALVHEPDFLILDEPFSGLDPVGVDSLARILDVRVRQGVGVLFSSHQLDLVERLCDAVGIIKAGRIVASGTVEELRRSNRPRRYRIGVAAPAGWAADVPGVVRAEYDGSDDADATTIVELTSEADDQRLLDAARRAGRVTAFAPIEPTLTELFREAVSNRALDEEQPGAPSDRTDARSHESREVAV
ncbi:MAG TPA: ATP-binding cassette domain-containing protein [Actinopolymorphaceae bacterium]